MWWVSKQFTDDMVTTAVENGGVGWFRVDEYRWQNLAPGEAFAVVHDQEDDEPVPHRIDRACVLAGLAVIATCVLREIPGGEEVPHNATTGERLYMHRTMVERIMRAMADPEDGAGDMDALDALAIVECGLFGRVVYA